MHSFNSIQFSTREVSMSDEKKPAFDPERPGTGTTYPNEKNPTEMPGSGGAKSGTPGPGPKTGSGAGQEPSKK